MYDKQDLDQAKFLEAVAGVLAGAVRGLAHQVLVAPAIYGMHCIHGTFYIIHVLNSQFLLQIII
jgi:hypothetical protein